MADNATAAAMILARALGYEYDPKRDVLEYAEVAATHLEELHNLQRRKKGAWTVTATEDNKPFARMETPHKEEACQYAVSLNSRHNMFKVSVVVHGPAGEKMDTSIATAVYLLDLEAERRGGKPAETNECPGCGEVFGCVHELHDHMGEECEYPNEKRMTVTIEARRLNDPGWRELHSVVEETRCAVFAKKHGGEIRACRHGGIEYATRDGSVWYIDRAALIDGFLNALKEED